MKIPEIPPSFDPFDTTKILEWIRIGQKLPESTRYHHWDKLRWLRPPEGLTHQDWWCALKLKRALSYRPCPLLSTVGKPFQFTLADPISEYLRDIDSRASGVITVDDPITNPDQKDRYLVSSLIAEAITSSQIEGAATAREIAKEMIRTGRPPHDASERMILNNFLTMRRIGRLRNEPLTQELVLDLQRMLTEETLNDPADAGRFRRTDQQIDVGNDVGQVFHRPPPADELEKRMAAMCDFANGKTPEKFLHPVLRSIILHFWLAYDHPFVDGNGRTARALFYWSMLRQGYWLCEFISISEIIRQAPAKYGRAFLYTETDDNDLTYFILYHLDVIRRAIDQLHDYARRKTRELRNLERQVRAISVLNHRQQALIGHAMRHPQQVYTVQSHQRSHNVVYETARTDLLNLASRGLLRSRKAGREWQFVPASDLEQRLRHLGQEPD